MVKESTPSSEQLFIGIDGGGTKCCARLFNANGDTLGTGSGGPANPFHDEYQAKASILHAVETAFFEARLPISAMANVIAGAGLAGVNVPAVCAAMNTWQHPFKKMYITTDLHIACLGAHSQAEGAVIVTGTGSCGYSFVNGTATMIGGHGFILGDIGSGAWFGLEAVKAVLLDYDNLGNKTLLSELLGDYLHATGIMLVEKMGAAKSHEFAQLAGFVFEAANLKDDVATQIVRDGADYINTIAEKLWKTEPGRMSLIGGLSASLVSWLKPDVTARLSPPINQPEFGALYFAKQQQTLSKN